MCNTASMDAVFMTHCPPSDGQLPPTPTSTQPQRHVMSGPAHKCRGGLSCQAGFVRLEEPVAVRVVSSSRSRTTSYMVSVWESPSHSLEKQAVFCCPNWWLLRHICLNHLHILVSS